MDTIVVALIVAGAVAYVGRKVQRAVRVARANRDGGCAGGCCAPE